MRRILTGFAAAAAVTAFAASAFAGNQDVADQIARELRGSGQMSDYRIGVKCQNGTAWLRGSVANEEQRNAALNLAFHTPGVARVVNELTVVPTAAAQPAPREASQASYESDAATPAAPTATASRNPLRGQGAIPLAENPRRPPNAGLAKRLETAIVRGPEAKPVAYAQRAPNSYRAAAAEQASAREEMPLPMAQSQGAMPMGTRVAMQACPCPAGARNGPPLPMYTAAAGGAGAAPARYDQPCLPNYAWPSYAAYPNYAAVTYPKQYSPTAWPYIGPFYPYPQVPLGWRKVTLQWSDGWWFLDFKDQPASCWHR